MQYPSEHVGQQADYTGTGEYPGQRQVRGSQEQSSGDAMRTVMDHGAPMGISRGGRDNYSQEMMMQPSQTETMGITNKVGGGRTGFYAATLKKKNQEVTSKITGVSGSENMNPTYQVPQYQGPIAGTRVGARQQVQGANRTSGGGNPLSWDEGTDCWNTTSSQTGAFYRKRT